MHDASQRAEVRHAEGNVIRDVRLMWGKVTSPGGQRLPSQPAR